MPMVHKPLWGVDICSVFVSYLLCCIAKQGWQRFTCSVDLTTGRGRNDPKIGYRGKIKLEDAKNMRNNLSFARKGNWMAWWVFSTSDKLPRAVGHWMGEEPGMEDDPPKIYFPCDLNDNSSHPASWLDWETSFPPCYPIIQTTHVYLKWSLWYISCQPRYTFHSKEGVNWQRCKNMFLLFQFLSNSHWKKGKERSTHKMLVVSDLFCLQSFVFKQLQYLHLQFSFWVCAGASHCIFKAKNNKKKLVLWFMELCFRRQRSLTVFHSNWTCRNWQPRLEMFPSKNTVISKYSFHKYISLYFSHF